MRKKLVTSILCGTMVLSAFAPVGNNIMPLSQNNVVAAAETDAGKIGDNVTYSVDSDGTLTLSGTGDMWDEVSIPDSKTIIKKIVVGEGITTIGEGNLEKVSSNVEEVKLPSTLKTIKTKGIGYISGKIVIPASVNKIQIDAIRAEQVELMGSPAKFERGAIKASEVIVHGAAEGVARAIYTDVNDYYSYDKAVVTVANDNTQCTYKNGIILSKDGTKACYYAGSKDEVTIPDSVVIVEPYAFAGTGCEKITFGKEVTTVKEYAFYDSALRKVKFNNKLTTIGRYAFVNSNVKAVTLNSTVKIAAYAFDKITITNTKGIKKSMTSIIEAKLGSKYMVRYDYIAGAKGYEVNFKANGKNFKYTTVHSKLTVKPSKKMKVVEGKKVKMTVRPYTIKKGKKVYGKWSAAVTLEKE